MKKIKLIALGISVLAMNNGLSASQINVETQDSRSQHIAQPAQQVSTQLETVRYRFGAAGLDAEFPFAAEGLSGKEEFHRWTDGKKLSITIPPIFDNKICKRLIFKDIIPLITPTHSQSVTILLNDKVYQKFVFSAQNPNRVIDLPLPFDLTRPAVISFVLPNACDPKNGDPRNLALALRTVDMVYELSQQQVVNLGTDQTAPLILSKGFSGAEITHRWLADHEATLRVPHLIDGKSISQITFNNLGALINDTHSQKLIISGEGIERQEYEFNQQTPWRNVTINLPWNRKGDFDLKFEMPNACFSSFSDQPSGDSRKLSISLGTATVTSFDVPKRRPLPATPPKPVVKPAEPQPAHPPAARDKLMLIAAAEKIAALRIDPNYRPRAPKSRYGSTLMPKVSIFDDAVQDEEWEDREDIPQHILPSNPEVKASPVPTPGKIKLLKNGGSLLEQIRAQHKDFTAPEPAVKHQPAARHTPARVDAAPLADASTSMTSALHSMLQRQRMQAFDSDDL